MWHIDPVTVQQQASPAERAGTISAPTFMRASSMVGTAVEPVRWWVDIEIHVLRLRLRLDLSRTSLQCDGHRLYTRWRAVASPGPRPGGTSRIRTLYSPKHYCAPRGARAGRAPGLKVKHAPNASSPTVHIPRTERDHVGVPPNLR